MDTFFSIIYITLNASLKERISAGMIMSNGKETKFRFSSSKLNIIKQLIPSQNHSFLKSYFKNIDKDILSFRNDKKELGLQIQKSNNWVNKSYFNYLSQYSNNLVEFSTPIKIDVNVDDLSFNTLYNKYVFESDVEVIKSAIKEDFNSIIQNKLYSRIETKVNIDAEINPSDFTELISPVNVNFIGKNGKIVSGQTIDFKKRYFDLERDLNKYISFTKAVDYQFGKGHYFLVGKEPSKEINAKNHTIWKHIFESRIVEYVNLNETNKIVDYIDSENVTPFFSGNVSM